MMIATTHEPTRAEKRAAVLRDLVRARIAGDRRARRAWERTVTTLNRIYSNHERGQIS